MDPAPLTTERLTLRALADGDAAALHGAWSDPEVMRFWHVPAAGTLDDSVAMLDAMRANPSACYWAIVVGDEGPAIGHVGFPSTSAGRRCPFGYLIARAHWGRGYAAEAAAAALRAGVETLGLAGAELWIYEGNRRSERLAEKLGCRPRGRFPGFNLMRREIIPTLVYGITARELGVDAAPPDPVAFCALHPSLAVDDVRAAIAFYCGALGFQLDWSFGEPPLSASVSRVDWQPVGVTIRFQLEPDAPAERPGALVIGVDDVDRLAEELAAAGVGAADGPADRPWGMRELEVQDPFGHRLRFVTPAR